MAREQAPIGCAQIASQNERDRGIDAAIVLGLQAEHLEPFDGIDHHRGCTGVVVSEGCRAHKGHLGPQLAGYLGNLFIIGRDHDVVKASRRLSGLNGVGEHGLTTE
ncbi:hypothetical protein D3C79_978640 [compost metagenome]